MSRENVEAVRAIYEEWANGNLRTRTDIYERLVVMIPGADATDARHYVGVEAMREYMRNLLAALENFSMAADELFEVENSVVVNVFQRGVGRESGAPAEMRNFAVWTFRGRKCVRLETFPNRAEALEAVGLRE